MKLAVTGATGSLGTALITALSARPDLTRLVALSRDEVKSGDLAERFGHVPALRCVLADVRDRERLEQAFWGCDAVIHAAALKRVTQSVYSPGELVKTNVLGTMHAIHAATEAGVGKVLVVSSDKAVEPVNLYGMTKAVAECYAVQSNSYAYPRGTRVACVRYGNVLGSRGSVVGIWRDQLARGEALTLTDPAMTRFILTLDQAAAFCLAALEDMEGGEVFVPRLPAASIADMARAVHCCHGRSVAWRSYSDGRPPETIDIVERAQITGLRPGGEKLHEALLSREEPARTWWDGHRMVIRPSHHSWREKFEPPATGHRETAPYTSDAPDRWLRVEELVEMLKEA